jgi:hypothetical protein
MENNTSNSPTIFDVSGFITWEDTKDIQPKKTPEYPKTTTGVVRGIKRDLKQDYQFFIKDKKIKEIRITKIDKKEGIMHLWVHKTDRTQISRILGLLREYPFKYTIFTTDAATKYVFKCTVEVNPTDIPKGIVVLN